jgi:hypothetical protein
MNRIFQEAKTYPSSDTMKKLFYLPFTVKISLQRRVRGIVHCTNFEYVPVVVVHKT